MCEDQTEHVAPEPSGYLHIGHLKAAILNRFLADQYQGQFILRFDDTNPLKEDVSPLTRRQGLWLTRQELFEQSIKEDLAMIEISYDKVVHSSDHFDKILQYTEQLIKQGDAYMDDTDGETVSIFVLSITITKQADQLAATSSRTIPATRCYYRREHD